MSWDKRLEWPTSDWNSLTVKVWEEKLFRMTPNEFEYCRAYAKRRSLDVGLIHRKYRERVELGRGARVKGSMREVSKA